MGKINSQLSAHDWNSNFEQGLVEAALAVEVDGKKVHQKLVEKNAEGKVESTETNANFLKRTGFKLDGIGAQKLADGIVFPPVSKPRGEKVDKDLVERIQLATAIYNSEDSLARFQKKCTANEVAFPDINSAEDEDAAIRMIADTIQAVRMSIAA